MALIQCPECKRYMSAREPKCIYCGQDTTKSNLPILKALKYREPRATSIGQRGKNLTGSVLLTVGGLLLIAMGFATLHALSLIGVFLFIAGGILLIKASSASTGSYSVFCPHCGRQGMLNGTATEYQCHTCSKKSFKHSDHLISIK